MPKNLLLFLSCIFTVGLYPQIQAMQLDEGNEKQKAVVSSDCKEERAVSNYFPLIPYQICQRILMSIRPVNQQELRFVCKYFHILSSFYQALG